MGTRINYVVATWSGERRLRVLDWGLPNEHPSQVPDLQRPRFHMPDHPMGYVRAQLKYLEWCEPKLLTQITIMNNLNPDETPQYREFLNNLPKDILGIPVVLIDRQNIGYSFGSFSHAYELYRKNFDYYWFTEDDYWPTQKGFDKIAYDMIQERDEQNKQNGKPPVGWLCMMATPWAWPVNGVQVTKDHAAAPHGLAKSEACEKTVQRQGFLSHKRGRVIPLDPRNKQPMTYPELCIDGQVMFSWDFVDSGYTVEDWRDRYAHYFAHENGQIGWASARNGNEEPMIMCANGIHGGFPYGGLADSPDRFKKPSWPVLVELYSTKPGILCSPIVE